MFTAALLTIAKMWEQSKCPLTERKLVHTYSGTLSSLKKKAILLHAMVWMNFGDIVKGNKPVIRRQTPHDFTPYMLHLKQSDSLKQKVERCLPGLRGGERGFQFCKRKQLQSPVYHTAAVVNNTDVYNEKFVKRTALTLCAFCYNKANTQKEICIVSNGPYVLLATSQT